MAQSIHDRYVDFYLFTPMVHLDSNLEVIPGLADNKEWNTCEGRRTAHDAIDANITAWSRALDHYEAARMLQAAGVPAVGTPLGIYLHIPFRFAPTGWRWS